MGYRIDEIEGIGSNYATKLATAGIRTTDDFLEHCRTSTGRRIVGERTGLSTKLLLKWANQADLMRISGVGPQFAELLEAAGVDTVKELKNRIAENLAKKVDEVNRQKNLARTTPSVTQIADWIDKAKELAPIISH